MNRQEVIVDDLGGTPYEGQSLNQKVVKRIIHGERRLSTPSKVERSRRKVGELTHWRDKEANRRERHLERLVEDLFESFAIENPRLVQYNP